LATMEEAAASEPHELDLFELLNNALGSGEYAGAVNFNTLKQILESLLLNRNVTPGKAAPASFNQSHFNKFENRLANLELQISYLNQPKSANTLITESEDGNNAIQTDWELAKLKKRVDANEEGITKTREIMDQLTGNIKDVKTDLRETKKRIQAEQKIQDEAIALNKTLLAEHQKKLDTFEKMLTDFSASVSSGPSDSVMSILEDKVQSCVSWDALDSGFKIDFFKNEMDDGFKEKREKYPFFFDGLQSLSELSDRLNEMPAARDSSMQVLETYTIEDEDTGERRTLVIGEYQKPGSKLALNQNAMDNIKNLEIQKAIQAQRSQQAISREPSELNNNDPDDLQKENDELREELEKARAENFKEHSKKRMSVISRKSIKNDGDLPVLMGLDDRLRDFDVFSETAQLTIDDHDLTLLNHAEQIDKLTNLKDSVDRILNDMGNFSRFMEENRQTTGPPDGDTIIQLEKKMSGTERELARMAELMQQLHAEGDQKNQELEDLQNLLVELQERAAMRDVVMDDLDKKANAADLEGMLSRNELEATADAIVHQLQDVITKQAAAEAHLESSIQKVGQKVEESTMKDEFDPFKNDIEQSLRMLRKKIESSRKAQDGLMTAEGAAGFRRQLYNCISCDKNLNLTAMRPILPEPSAFPSRISLRPYMGEGAAHHVFYSQMIAKYQSRLKGAFRESISGTQIGNPAPDTDDDANSYHLSHYSTILAEREQERKRKRIENKIRQDINPFTFRSGFFPRQVGGLGPQKQLEPASINKEKEERYARLKKANSLNIDLEANLEGTDGHLYRGRIRALPGLKPTPGKADPALQIGNTAKKND